MERRGSCETDKNKKQDDIDNCAYLRENQSSCFDKKMENENV